MQITGGGRTCTELSELDERIRAIIEEIAHHQQSKRQNQMAICFGFFLKKKKKKKKYSSMVYLILKL